MWFVLREGTAAPGTNARLWVHADYDSALREASRLAGRELAVFYVLGPKVKVEAPPPPVSITFVS